MLGTPHNIERILGILLTRSVEDKETGCRVWQGPPNGSGYGQLGFDGKHYEAHRFAWLGTTGDIPEGLEIDHLCRNRLCVQTRHMEVVTPAENKRRARAYAESRCCFCGCHDGFAMPSTSTVQSPTGHQQGHSKGPTTMQDTENRADIRARTANGLRLLADAIDTNPDVPVSGYLMVGVEDAAAVERAAATQRADVTYRNGHTHVDLIFDGVELHVYHVDEVAQVEAAARNSYAPVVQP